MGLTRASSVAQAFLDRQYNPVIPRRASLLNLERVRMDKVSSQLGGPAGSPMVVLSAFPDGVPPGEPAGL